jgi:hypothetical protein
MTARKTGNDESEQLQIPSLHCGMTTRKTGNNNGQGDDWVEGLAGIS